MSVYVVKDKEGYYLGFFTTSATYTWYRPQRYALRLVSKDVAKHVSERFPGSRVLRLVPKRKP